MTAKTHIPVRDTRDRLTDLLAFGQTYPLRDLPVGEEALIVPYNTSAKIPVQYSQLGVLYQLHFDGSLVTRPEDDEGGGVPIEASGTGETILLETYRIQEDITFDIYAIKDRPPNRAAYLHQTATVKVGLDTQLRARIIGLPTLDPNVVNPPDTAPRLAEYGARVQVEIEQSQEGVDYKLILIEAGEELVISEAEVTGDLGTITLTTEPVREDVEIRIRGTKTFEPSEGRETQTGLLDVILPLKVRPNPALPVSVQPEPIIDYNQEPSIVLGNTQQSVRYRLYQRPIPDQEIVHGEVPEAEVIKVSVPDEPDAQIRKPPRTHAWKLPHGYEAVGDFQGGNGADLGLPLPPLNADSLFIVRAQKEHQAADDQVLPSNLQLEQAVAVLVHPNPDQPLDLMVYLVDAQTGGQLEVQGGQLGVFYQFSRQSDGNTLGLPAYFHQRDDQNEALNKGLDQLKIGVDLVIARSRPADQTVLDPAQIPPRSPLVETGPLPVDTTLQIRAMKAQTRVATMHNQTVTIAPLPEIQLQDTVVDYNKATRLQVIASVQGDRYQPFLDDTEFKRALNGNGQDLSFNTDALTEDTEYEMHVTRPSESGLALERRVRLLVRARPNPGLSVSAAEAVVAPNGETEIRVEATQNGVSYQLLAGDTTLGEPVPGGGGGRISLPTGPLTETTTFAVQATRIEWAEISVMLVQTVTVQVQADGENS